MSLAIFAGEAPLSKLENGGRPVTLERRNQMMAAYGYHQSSFKNLSTDPVRSKRCASAALNSKY